MFGKKRNKSVTLRFQDKTYVLKRGWFFHPNITIEVTGDLAGTLTVNKQLDIEVVSID